jgi:hypothetical protein
VDEHRSQLVRAALILIKAWVVAGMPLWRDKTLGSYEQWSAVMGGILENAGIEGFLDNLEEFYEVADVEGACWEEFVGRWWEAYEAKAVSVADLVEIAQETGIQVNGATSSAQRVSLGMQLTKRRDQVIAGCRLLLAGKVQGSARWKLVSGKKVKV